MNLELVETRTFGSRVEGLAVEPLEEALASARINGAIEMPISSTSPAARYRLTTDAPPGSETSSLPAASFACASADSIPSLAPRSIAALGAL